LYPFFNFPLILLISERKVPCVIDKYTFLTGARLRLVKMASKNPLTYKVIAKCSTTKARVGLMSLIHSDVSTPVFMPVGTQGTLKGLLPDQLINLDCQIILGNTYHLGMRPVSRILHGVGPG
jgi:hypothetical protein